MTKFEENPVNATEAARVLGYSASSISALKRSMGITSRKFFLSDARKFLRNNPHWSTTQVYHLKSCQCLPCLKKRAAKALQPPKVSAVPPAPETTVESSSSEKTSTHLGKADGRVSVQKPGSLGAKLRSLRGARPATDVAAKTGLSRESVFRIERGDPVKLATVRELAAALNVTPAERLDLLVAWTKQTLGDDAMSLVIETRSNEKTVHGSTFARQAAQATSLLERLHESQREDFILALQNRDILKCISTMVKLSSGNPTPSKSGENQKAIFAALT